MKINTIRILTFSFLLLIVTSCSFEEDNVFGDTAAVRMDKALASYEEVLCDAENGWIMEYFPTDTTEGYTIWMKFNSSTKVDMMAQNRWTNNLLLSDSCVFDLLADDGPVLSFPVAGNYSTPGGIKVGIFHLFALPQDPMGSTSALNGYGLMGDYEFIIMNASENLLELKGKKRSTRILLRKLSADMTPESYFQKIDLMRTYLFQNNNEMQLSLVDGTDTLNLLNNLYFYGKQATKYRIYQTGSDPVITGIDRAYIITPDGIRFHTLFDFNEEEVGTFKLSDDRQKLICTDSLATASIVGPNPVKYLFNASKTWKFNTTMDMGNDLKTIYDLIVLNCQTKYKEKFQSLNWTYSTVRKSFTLMFVSGKYTGYFDFNKTINGDQLLLQYAGTQDKNAQIYMQNIDGFSQLLDALSQPFTISPLCGLNLTLIQMNGVNNSNVNYYIN